MCQARTGFAQPRVARLLRHDIVDDFVNVIAITEGIDNAEMGLHLGVRNLPLTLLGERPQHMSHQRVVAGCGASPLLLQQTVEHIRFAFADNKTIGETGVDSIGGVDRGARQGQEMHGMAGHMV